MKAIVVATDKNSGIGAKNDLLWQRDLPADLAHFKKITTGGSIIMGRKTYESIGRPLPNRQNIVVTSGQPIGVTGVLSAASLETAYTLAQFPIFVIGGGSVYKQALGDMDKLFVTEIDADFPQATVFFPEISPQLWREISREHHEADEKNKYAYDFVVYEKAT